MEAPYSSLAQYSGKPTTYNIQAADAHCFPIKIHLWSPIQQLSSRLFWQTHSYNIQATAGFSSAISSLSNLQNSQLYDFLEMIQSFSAQDFLSFGLILFGEACDFWKWPLFSLFIHLASVYSAPLHPSSLLDLSLSCNTFCLDAGGAEERDPCGLIHSAVTISECSNIVIHRVSKIYWPVWSLILWAYESPRDQSKFPKSTHQE